MKRQLTQLSYLLAVAFALTALPASAGPFNLSNISGVWQNPQNGLSVSGVGTSTITWGDGVPPESGYSFVAGADIVGAAVATPIALGTFIHYNQVIPVPNLTGVDLAFGFDTNGVPANVAAVFTFEHDETPNNTGTSPADDDIVTITTPFVNVPITVGTDVFFFNLLGFSIDGGASFKNVFSSQEGGTNSAVLYGQITEHRVPEPASLTLLGSGLSFLALRLRKRQRS